MDVSASALATSSLLTLVVSDTSSDALSAAAEATAESIADSS